MAVCAELNERDMGLLLALRHPSTSLEVHFGVCLLAVVVVAVVVDSPVDSPAVGCCCCCCCCCLCYDIVRNSTTPSLGCPPPCQNPAPRRGTFPWTTAWASRVGGELQAFRLLEIFAFSPSLHAAFRFVLEGLLAWFVHEGLLA